MVRSSWSGSAGAVLVGVLALGGCAGDSEADGSSSSSTASPRVPSSSSESTSTSTSASGSGSSSSSTSGGSEGAGELPEEATKNTKEGAAAFFEHYFVAIGKASQSGQTDDLETLSRSDCPPCSQVIKSIKADKKKGWVMDRQPYTLSRSKATERPDEGYKATMVVDVVEHFRVDKTGKRNATSKAERYRATSHVVWEDGHLLIADWVIEDV